MDFRFLGGRGEEWQGLREGVMWAESKDDGQGLLLLSYSANTLFRIAAKEIGGAERKASRAYSRSSH